MTVAAADPGLWERASTEGREPEGRASPARGSNPAALGNRGHAGRQAGRGRLSPSAPTPATHLLAAGIVAKLIIAGMQGLPSIDGVQDHLVPHDHLWGRQSG